MACLPSTFSANIWARLRVPSEVVSAGISSTSCCTGAGLKKWMPTTWSGREVATASFTSGMEEVLEARIASGRVTTWSSTWKISVFTGSLSTTASITRSRSANSPRSVVKPSRAWVASRSSSEILPRSAALERELYSRVRPISRASPVVSATFTFRPARAHTSAMPAPIWPQPTTPTRSISPDGKVTSSPSLVLRLCSQTSGFRRLLRSCTLPRSIDDRSRGCGHSSPGGRSVIMRIPSVRGCADGTHVTPGLHPGGGVGADGGRVRGGDHRGHTGGADRPGRAGGHRRARRPCRRRDAGRVDGDGREPRLALPSGPRRRRPARRAGRPPRPGGAQPAEHGDPPGAADRRRPVALAVRALVAVPHRDPGPRPRLGPAGHRRARGPRAGAPAARLVQPVPHRQPHRPGPARPLAPGPDAPRLGGAVRREAVLQPRPARRPRLRPAGDAGRGRPLPRRRGPLRRLLLPLSRGRADLRGRRRLRPLRRRFREPGGLAAGQHRPAGLGDGGRDRTGPARHPLRDQPLRGVAQRHDRPARLRDGRGRADVRRPVRGHPPLGPRALDRLRRAPALLGDRRHRGGLHDAAGLVGRGSRRHRDPALHRRGPVPGRDRGGRRAAGGLAGPGGAVPAPHARRPASTGRRAPVLRRPGHGRRPHRGDAPRGRGPLHATGEPAPLSYRCGSSLCLTWQSGPGDMIAS
ncbi:hypothetical protein SGPA1_20248 [Streptomyces misionensis JCM 4497]